MKTTEDNLMQDACTFTRIENIGWKCEGPSLFGDETLFAVCTSKRAAFSEYLKMRREEMY